MKLENKYNRMNYLAVVILILSCLPGCSTGEENEKISHEENSAMENKEKKNKPGPIKPKSKPKTSKSMSELESIPKGYKVDEIRIIPIGDPETGLKQRKGEGKQGSEG